MQDTEALLHEVADAEISCKKKKVIEVVGKAKSEPPPAEIIEKGLSAGMNHVGVLFERGKLLLPHVMMAIDAMTTGVKVLEADFPVGAQNKKLGVS